MIRGSVLHKDITTLNMHMNNNRALNRMRQKLIELQEEVQDGGTQVYPWLADACQCMAKPTPTL